MSAIWGAISFHGHPLPRDLGPRMKQPYEACVIDRFGECADEEAVMGCGIQHITAESLHEALPFSDPDNQILFTADIMLDNRRQMMDKLGMTEVGRPIPDGEIAYELFRRYGEDCLNDMLGAYAFVFYDKKTKTASLVTDATGCRCLYYKIKDGALYFSTLVEPLLAVAGNEGVNERWIADFLAMDSLGVRTGYEETPYAGVYRVAPRQIITFDGQRLHKRSYWNPDAEDLILSGDEAYAARLNEIFSESVGSLLRAEKTSLLLSAGLDSSAVACYAARALREQGKALYTYTAVPEPDYVSERSSYFVTDESDRVLKTKEYLEADGCRLECKFLDLAGINGWDARAAELRALEFPYKSLQNVQWVTEAMRAAHASGSRVMLSGGFGNVSISTDGIDSYLIDLLHRRRYITFLRQHHTFCRAYGYGKKTELKKIWGFVKEFIAKPTVDTGDALLKKSLVNRDILEQSGAMSRLIACTQAVLENRYRFKGYKNFFVHDLIFAMDGEMATKHSLATGVLYRDPTMNKKLIEFCLRLPVEQFARDGVSRRLVRVYMADRLPGHLLSPKQYGLQSADFNRRIGRHWERIHAELVRIFEENVGSLYVDCQKALRELERVTEHAEKAEAFEILRVCYTAMVLEFIRHVERL